MFIKIHNSVIKLSGHPCGVKIHNSIHKVGRPMPRHAVRRKKPPIPCISKNTFIISVHLHIEKAATAAYTKLIM